MTTVKVTAHVGADGMLNLQIPTGITNADLEVIVVVAPAARAQAPEDLGWSPGFFEMTAGAWQGEPLVRAPQGEYETRRPLQ